MTFIDRIRFHDWVSMLWMENKLISCKAHSNFDVLLLGYSCIFRTNKRSCRLFQFRSGIRRGSAFYIIYCNNQNTRNRTFLYYNFSILPVIGLQHIMSKLIISMKTHRSAIYNIQIHSIYEDCHRDAIFIWDYYFNSFGIFLHICYFIL